ncbi:MAG TPA: hypothetical protein P5125_02795 [Kiritimatiellia bacterium]|jgi:adenosylcobinamide amidohydrolase|nr:hypothetical protein [Kiritimatiellia bacterium]HOR97045.1 hypothetical protein [Kiritimatiellia bacterium]HPW74713.1 hypothetical protein [Kiritimatiellia bacterium]HRU19259.1 hypothetical protein [Kiritimatiellia bacterium]
MENVKEKMVAVAVFMAMAAVAEPAWTFTIEDHPAEVTASATTTDAVAVASVTSQEAPSGAGGLTAFVSAFFESLGINLRSDPFGTLFLFK